MLILLGFLISLITLTLFFVLSVRILISFGKKKPFPKKTLLAMLVGIALVSSIYTYEMYFFTFNRIDKKSIQNGPGPVLSPTENYTANAYYEPYGGAAGGVNVWVEITNHAEDDKKSVIYYSDANLNIDLAWINEKLLLITNTGPSNNSIKLDVEKEIYHDRGLACLSWVMKDEYETCYQE